MATFEEKAKSFVSTAAQIARSQNAEPIATVLEKSSPSLIQSGSDPEGPTVYYTLMLEVPIRTYAAIEEERESLERTIRDRLRPIVRPHTDNWISEVIISPTLALESRPTAPAPEQGEAVEETPSFWQPGFFRLFISHTSAYNVSDHKLRTALTNEHV